MRILLTNDDGYDAAGLAAAFDAISALGSVHVVAPAAERSACSHSISLYRPIRVRRFSHAPFGMIHSVDGTPADCVRLAVGELLDAPIDLVISGINSGANTGVDLFYSGTIAAAREAAILGLPAIAVSQAARADVETDWRATAAAARSLIEMVRRDTLPSAGFWSINLPAPIPQNFHEHVHRVPMATETVPISFERRDGRAGAELEYVYGRAYWVRQVSEPSDFSVVRDGGIAITAIPLFGRF